MSATLSPFNKLAISHSVSNLVTTCRPKTQPVPNSLPSIPVSNILPSFQAETPPVSNSLQPILNLSNQFPPHSIKPNIPTSSVSDPILPSSSVSNLFQAPSSVPKFSLFFLLFQTPSLPPCPLIICQPLSTNSSCSKPTPTSNCQARPTSLNCSNYTSPTSV